MITLTPGLSIAFSLFSGDFSTITFLPPTYSTAIHIYATVLQAMTSSSGPYVDYIHDLISILSTTSALLRAFGHAIAQVSELDGLQRALDRQRVSLRRSDRWPTLPLGILDEAKRGVQAEVSQRMDRNHRQMRIQRCELAQTQRVVAGELAAWQDFHAQQGRAALRHFAKSMLIQERERLAGLRRAWRAMHN